MIVREKGSDGVGRQVIHVLYVDDESSLLDLAREFLGQSGDFTVTTATCVPDAIRLLEQDRFDAIISDYQMPEMDGIEFLKYLKAKSDTTPFIIFTGKGREEVVIEALNAGADFYLQKGGESKSLFAELSNKIRYAVSRRRADDALKRSEEKYRHLIEHSDEAIIVAQDGMLKLVNHRTVEFTGYSEQELLSMPFLVFIHPDDRAMVGERYQKRMKGGESPARYSFRLRLKDAGTRWVELSVVTITWEERPATLNFLTDITERKRAEDALRESEERYRNVVEDQTEFICRFLPDGTHVFVNEAYCRYFGKTREEIIGQRFRPRIPPEDRESVARLFASLTPEHPVDVIDQRIIMPDDSIRWQRWSDRAIFSADDSLKEYQSVGRDITDRKRDEEELQEREEKFRTLAESSPDYIMRYDKHGRHTYINPAGLRVSGLTEDQIIGKTHRESGFDENLSRFWEEKITGVFETKKSYQTQFVRERAGGRVVFDWMLTPEFSLDGTVRSVLGVSRNITQLKKAEEELLKKNEELIASYEQIAATEEELRQQVEEIKVTQEALRVSEEKYREFFTISRDSVFITSPDGRWIDFNDATLELFGYESREELSKVLIPSLYAHPEERLTFLHRIEREGYVKEYPVRLMQKDGTVIDTLITTVPVRNPDGSLKAFIGTIRDNTERKRAEESLQETNEYLHKLIDFASAPIIVWDPTFTIIRFNHAFERLRGRIEQEVIGQPLDILFPKKSRDTSLALIKKTLAGEQWEAVEIPILASDGTSHTVLWNTANILTPEGELISTIAQGVDISGRKQDENLIALANRKLALMNDVTYQYIQNKITALRGYAALSKEAKTEDNWVSCIETEEHILSDIHQLIKNTRDYQKIGLMKPRWIPAEQSIRIAVSLVSPKQGISIEIDLQGLELYTDPLIEKIFANLVENAVIHGKTLTRITFSCEKTQEELILTCENDGVGISPEDKSGLFNQCGGHKICFGLFFIRECLALSGMKIAETGESGKGARFEITVPNGLYRFTDTGEQ